jgi:hypothetical protein
MSFCGPKISHSPFIGKVWELVFTILYCLKIPLHMDYVGKALGFEQCLFNKRLLKSLKRFNYLWMLSWCYSLMHTDRKE